MSASDTPQPTPLEPRKFFKGTWHGEGELIPGRLFSLLVPAEHFHYQCTTKWVSDSAWLVYDRFEFTSGQVMELHLAVEIACERRLRVTSADIPGGVDILLFADGFEFTPYIIKIRRWGISWRLRCLDTNRLSPPGLITDTIKMRILGLPVATMQIHIVADRGP